MKQAAIIIEGIRFPYFLADRVVAWAKKEGASLYGLFLVSGSEVPEGYVFPSDMDLATTLNDMEDAEQDSIIIVQDQMKFFADSGRAAGVPVQVEMMVDPSLEQVLEKIKPAAQLFLAAGQEMNIETIADFSMDDLLRGATCPVEVVAEPD